MTQPGVPMFEHIVGPHVSDGLEGRYVLVSAGVPTGSEHPFEITDAVVAAASAIFSHGGRIISRDYPTKSSLTYLMAHVGNDFTNGIQVSRLPLVRKLPAYTDEAQLEIKKLDPVGAIFIGGNNDVYEEFRRYRAAFPDKPAYPIAGTGGAAKTLLKAAAESREDLRTQLPHDMLKRPWYPYTLSVYFWSQASNPLIKKRNARIANTTAVILGRYGCMFENLRLNRPKL
ncbi:MAG: hypothetical protein HY051_01840 [Candidatus Aenigmarchaeota archaeon]|nr:hypothetical protein [Candidatus Aenigmarchaeota archaeon]